MILIRFYRTDGKPIEEYYYRSISDALYHMHLFRSDTSSLYDKIELIVLLNEYEEIIDTIQF